MQFIKIKTRKFLPPQDDIYELLNKLPKLKNGDVLIVTSKILAIYQGRCIKIDKNVNKETIIRKEAEKYLPKKKNKGEDSLLTIKNKTIVYSAGVDESNGNGYYVLRPQNINQAAKEIWQFLKKKCKLNKLGIIITDSTSQPLHYGAKGIAVGYWGLEPLKDYRGKVDIFGRKLKYERANLIDPLAAIGVFLIGEAAEQTPMLVIRGIKNLKFSNKDTSRNFFVPEKKDKLRALFKDFVS